MTEASIRVDSRDAEPLYKQIATQFRARINSNLWPSGYKLRSDAEMAVDLGVARGTLRQAIQQLVSEGLLEQVHGRGTFVQRRSQSSTARDALTSSPTSSGEQLEREAVFFETRVLNRRIVDRGSTSACLDDTQVLQLRRLRSLAEGPDAIIDSELPLTRFPAIVDLTDTDLVERPLHRLLKQHYEVTFADCQRIYSALSASQEAARLLDVPLGAPLLVYEQVSLDQHGRLIEHSHAWMRTDRHPHTVKL